MHSINIIILRKNPRMGVLQSSSRYLRFFLGTKLFQLSPLAIESFYSLFSGGNALNVLYMRSKLLQRLFRFQLNHGIKVEDDVNILSEGAAQGLVADSQVFVNANDWEIAVTRLGLNVEANEKPPILLVHGDIADCEIFIAGGDKSFAKFLVSSNFDVWVYHGGNSKYQIADSEDILKATINHVIQVTGHEKMICICFSSGCVEFTRAVTAHKSLQSKIVLSIFISPMLSTVNIRASTALSLLFGDNASLVFGDKLFRGLQLWRNILTMQMYARVVVWVGRLLFGWKFTQISKSRRAQVLQHLFPTISTDSFSASCKEQYFNGSSKQQYEAYQTAFARRWRLWQRSLSAVISLLEHFSGFVLSDKHLLFPAIEKLPPSNGKKVKFDTAAPAGSSTGSSPAPSAVYSSRSRYDIVQVPLLPTAVRYKDVHVPVAIFNGGEDLLSKPISVLKERLPHCVAAHTVPEYEHMDLLWADSAEEKVFRPLGRLLDAYRAEYAAERERKRARTVTS